MIITVEESYTIQPAQFEAIRVSSSVTVSHRDLGVPDEYLTTNTLVPYDLTLAVRLRDLANHLLWADLKPKLQLADEACAGDDNLAAYILSNHSDPQLPTKTAPTGPNQGEQENGSTKGNTHRPNGRLVVRSRA